MTGKLNKILNLVGNMGWRYVRYRIGYEFKRKTGMLKKDFPAIPPYQQYLSLERWKKSKAEFFFVSRETLAIERQPSVELEETFKNIRLGKFRLFSSTTVELGSDYDWVTNPDSGFRYDAHAHWTDIQDYSAEAGDIKYVWEKSRFSYLYDIIRYDYHFQVDCAAQVFNDIMSWIEANGVNCGPNYRCSQEMSLRVMNWTFALHYYKNSPTLTAEVFDNIQYTIYWHLHHIYHNIDFSRIAVRNNHALTETLMLCLAGIFYPEMPGVTDWSVRARKWFEEEVGYQIYDDGTFLQFSMNYHRVVVQLLTWAIVLTEKNGAPFGKIVYDRARKSVVFLRTCMIDEKGWLPNYGTNDGALFFRLSDAHYRDYQPQVQALARALGMEAGLSERLEDMAWYGINRKVNDTWRPADGVHKFPVSGYYLVREPDALTFIRCGNHRNRPFQADNLHIDIWYKGENIFPDAGSYKYNTDEDTMRYFAGTQSHNTVMLGDNDQMLKGGRFIWYYWTHCRNAAIVEEADSFFFDGTITAFSFLGKQVQHRRQVIKYKNKATWEINDEILNKPDGVPMRQLWHLPRGYNGRIFFKAVNSAGSTMTETVTDGWHSSLYGQKDRIAECCFTDSGNKIETTIMVTP